MSDFKYEFKNLCKSGLYHYSSAKVLFIDKFLDLLKSLWMKTVLQYHPNAPKL